MYIPFLIFLAVIASVGVSLSYKLGSQRAVDPISSPPLMCTLAALFIAAMYAVLGFAMDGGIAFPNKLSLFYAAIMGVAYAAAAVSYLLALESGPYTVTVIVLNISSFMPILYAHLFLREDISAWQLIGLAVMIVSCVLLTIVRNRGNKGGRINLRWMIFALLTFGANGFVSFSIRLNTKLAPETSRNSLFVAAYILAAVILFVIFVCTGGLKKRIRPKPLIAPALGVAGSLALQLTPNAILPQYLSAALQYPLTNGMSILFGVGIGVVFFKERIGVLGCICIAAIIAAMCMLGIG